MPARLGRCSHWSRVKSIMAMLRAPKALPIRCCLDHPRPHQYPGIKQQCPLRPARRRTFDSGHLHRCCTVGAARRHGSRPLIWQRGSVLWTVCESGGWGDLGRRRLAVTYEESASFQSRSCRAASSSLFNEFFRSAIVISYRRRACRASDYSGVCAPLVLDSSAGRFAALKKAK